MGFYYLEKKTFKNVFFNENKNDFKLHIIFFKIQTKDCF